MRIWVAILLMVVGLAACSGPKKPGSFVEGLEVKQSDVRIGLSADDGVREAAVLEGEGFDRLPSGSYVTLVEDGGGEGSLQDEENAFARGAARNSRDLQAYVYAKTTDDGTASKAEAVLLTTTVLKSTVASGEVRVEIDTVLDAKLSGGAVAVCEVLGEASLDGHPMTKIKMNYHLYPENGEVVLYHGPRGAGKLPVGTVDRESRFVAKDPSFYFDLGPGVYELFFTLTLSVSCPADQANSGASVRASSKVGLR